MPDLFLFSELGIHVDAGTEARSCRLTVVGKWLDVKCNALHTRAVRSTSFDKCYFCLESELVFTHGRYKSDQRSFI
jgi:hypothetical protein